jgi:hypothetical protein
VKIVTTAYDTQLDPNTGFICPGLGNFGDRYFGTDSIAYSSDTEEMTTSLSRNISFQSVTSNSPCNELNHDQDFSLSSVL